MALLDWHNFHLVGIKGVALTALAQCLLDAHKTVTGSDVAEDFVTQPLLDKAKLTIQTDFTHPLPPQTECVIYTAAHGGKYNPQVQAAVAAGIPVFSHAQALGELFNQKQGIAVCGVGGKSTTSAMIAWILTHTGHVPSYAIGVGNIPGLEKTGQWSESSTLFVAEADEYAEQPKPLKEAEQADWQLVPRFHYLNPWITVCTNLKYDHPDVYHDFTETKSIFQQFFKHIKPGGYLVCQSQDQALITSLAPPEVQMLTFGSEPADFHVKNYTSQAGATTTIIEFQQHTYKLTLKLPGLFNAYNALAALAAVHVAGVSVDEAISALASFHSTKRRFEYIGEKNGVLYYDDYAHHPDEITQTIKALKEWYPDKRLVVLFQSHTYSRTKQLLDEFVHAFSQADIVAMIDIFPSAREQFDPTISSDVLCQRIQTAYPQVSAFNLHTVQQLANYCQKELHEGDVAITLGAGDIYHVHELL